MTLRRSINKLAACVAAIALLFTQLAVSAFACPMVFNAALEHATAAESSETAAGDFVFNDGTTATYPALCKAHCQDSQNGLAASQTPVALDFVPAFTAGLAPLAMPWALRAPRQFAAAVPPAGPPILLRNCVFRI